MKRVQKSSKDVKERVFQERKRPQMLILAFGATGHHAAARWWIDWQKEAYGEVGAAFKSKSVQVSLHFIEFSLSFIEFHSESIGF